jgi:threonine synthase
MIVLEVVVKKISKFIDYVEEHFEEDVHYCSYQTEAFKIFEFYPNDIDKDEIKYMIKEFCVSPDESFCLVDNLKFALYRFLV